jgi:hypothetical protein
MISLTLRTVIFTFRIQGPIQREPVADEPISKVDAIDRTDCERLPILIKAYRYAIDRTSFYERGKLVRRLCAALVLDAVAGPAKLIAFRSINSPETNTRSVNLKCIAVNHRRLPGQGVA